MIHYKSHERIVIPIYSQLIYNGGNHDSSHKQKYQSTDY
jgi:hypothetical protein